MHERGLPSSNLWRLDRYPLEVTKTKVQAFGGSSQTAKQGETDRSEAFSGWTTDDI